MVHFKHAAFLVKRPIYMESPQRQRGVIGIHATDQHNMVVIPDLLVAHAISACDTVASHFWNWQGKGFGYSGNMYGKLAYSAFSLHNQEMYS